MAITIEANYSKKLGLPGYSSHQYSVTVKKEAHTLENLQEISSELYGQLQEAVDHEIQRTGYLPNERSTSVTSPPRQAVPTRGGITPDWACSPKQKQLISRLMREHNIAQHEVEDLARQRFGKQPSALNKMEASGLIDELIESTRNTTNTKADHS